MEAKTKTYYGLRIVAKKIQEVWTGRKYTVVVHLQNTPTYVKYKKEEDKVQAMVVATKEENVNMSKIVTMEHRFKDEGKPETTKKRKTLRWLPCTFKDRRRNYMKDNIYIYKATITKG